MNLINERLDEKFFESYYVFHLHLRPIIYINPHLLRLQLSVKDFQKLNNKFFLGWDYDVAILELTK